MPDSEGKDDVLAWRVTTLEKNLERLTSDVTLLMRALWMLTGAIAVVQVILPLVEKLGL